MPRYRVTVFETIRTEGVYTTEAGSPISAMNLAKCALADDRMHDDIEWDADGAVDDYGVLEVKEASGASDEEHAALKGEADAAEPLCPCQVFQMNPRMGDECPYCGKTKGA